MNNNIFENITKKASKTFYTTTLLFPKAVREDVFILYSFLRQADDLVDANPPRLKQFKKYKELTYKRLSGKKVNNKIIDTFGQLVERERIDPQLITDFFTSLEIDLRNSTYETFEDLKTFTYGVAEVVGILMASVMNLPKKSYTSARKLGLAMQLVNILRDIEEDLTLGRVYIPQQELAKYKLQQKISKEYAQSYPEEFKKLMKFQISRIYILFHDAQKGFVHLPADYLLPISSAAKIYLQTVKIIEKNPFIIFQKKVRISKIQMIYILIKNLFKKYARY